MAYYENIERIVLKEKGPISAHLLAYLSSDCHSLYDAYKKPSEAKQAAWAHCEEVRAACGGQSPKVCSYNSQAFTYGFVTSVIDNEWNVSDVTKAHSLVLVYITRTKQIHYLVPINLMRFALHLTNTHYGFRRFR